MITRYAIGGLITIFTGVVLLLSQSAFWTSAVSVWMRVIALGIALVSYFRPNHGLLLLAALVPLGQVGSRTLDSSMRGSESLVLAFLAGALTRGWTLHRFRDFPSRPLHLAALLFGIIVATSSVEQILFLRIRHQYPAAFLRDLLAYAARDYLTSSRGLEMIVNAMLLLEGVALLLYVAHNCRTRPGFSSAIVRMLIAGATAAAAINVAFVLGTFLETGEPYSQLARFLEGKRWTAHVSDVNAAGSFYVFAALLSLSIALSSSTHPLVWAALALVSGLALWMTASRAAILAFLAVGALVLGTHALTRPRWFSQVIGIATAGVAVVLVWRFPVQLVGSIAWEGVTFRWLFVETTLRMVASNPIFGVGVGQYPMWSSRFIPPELVGSQYASENAHNNFAQIAGELGLLGIAAFLAVLVVAMMGLRHRQARADNPCALPVLFGLMAFMVTWLGGHPLLVPEVAYPFWIALGVLAGVSGVPSYLGWKPLAATCLIVAILLFSIPWRVMEKEKSLTGRSTYRGSRVASSERTSAGS